MQPYREQFSGKECGIMSHCIILAAIPATGNISVNVYIIILIAAAVLIAGAAAAGIISKKKKK